MTTLVREYLEHRAETVPPDLCYVYNFGHARRSLPLLLSTGRGLQLKQDFDAFIVNSRRRSPRL